MKTADIQKLPTTTEFAVTRGRYRASDMNPRRLGRTDAQKVTLVNFNKYNETSRLGGSATDPYFTIAPAGERTYGFLVTNGTDYWVAKPVSFLDTYAECDKVWSVAEAQRALQQSENLRRDEAEALVMPQHRLAVEVMEDTTKEAIKRLLGADVLQTSSIDARAYTNWVTDETSPTGDRLAPYISGHVRIQFDAFQRLLAHIEELEEELRG
jgi:hypothetical protein